MKKFIALLSLSLLLAVSGCAGGTKPETQSATYPNIEDGTYEGTDEMRRITAAAHNIKISIIAGISKAVPLNTGRMAGIWEERVRCLHRLHRCPLRLPHPRVFRY